VDAHGADGITSGVSLSCAEQAPSGAFFIMKTVGDKNET